MPLYEYFCLDCRKLFDALRPMSQADAPICCQSCEGDKTRRTLSLFAAQASSSGGERPSMGGGCGCGGDCACGRAH